MRTGLLAAVLAILAGAALAQGGPRVMENPGLHPEGDGMPARSSRAPADGMPFHPATPEELAERCGADRLQGLVGGRWPVSLPQMRGPVRIFRTGDPVTMDHNPDRLNIQTNRARNRVVAVTCG